MSLELFSDNQRQNLLAGYAGDYDNTRSYNYREKVKDASGVVWEWTSQTPSTAGTAPAAGTDWANIASMLITGADGAKGDPGEGIMIQYSNSGIGAGHGTLAADDEYIRFSMDGGTTWSIWIKFVGDDGLPPTTDQIRMLIIPLLAASIQASDLQNATQVNDIITQRLAAGPYLTEVEIEQLNQRTLEEVVNIDGSFEQQWSIDGITWRAVQPATYNWLRFRAANTSKPWIVIPIGGSGGGGPVVTGLDLAFEFSVNGMDNWHETQVAADRYVRGRVGTGDPSNAILLPTGGGGTTNTDMTVTPDADSVEFQAGTGASATMDAATTTAAGAMTAQNITDINALKARAILAEYSVNGIDYSATAITNWTYLRLTLEDSSGNAVTINYNNSGIMGGGSSGTVFADYNSTTTYNAGDLAWYDDGSGFSGVIVSRRGSNTGNDPSASHRTDWWGSLSGRDITQIISAYAAEERQPDRINAFRPVAGTVAGEDGLIEANPTARFYPDLASIPEDRRHLPKWRVLGHAKNYAGIIITEAAVPIIDIEEISQNRAAIETSFPVLPIEVDNFENYAGYCAFRSINARENIDLCDLSFFDSSGTALEENVTFQSNALGRLDSNEIRSRASTLRSTNNTTGRISVRVVRIYAQIQGSLSHDPAHLQASGTGYAEIANCQSHTHFAWTALSPESEPAVRLVGNVTFTESDPPSNSETQGFIVVARVEPTQGGTPQLLVGNTAASGPAFIMRDAHGIKFDSSAVDLPPGANNYYSDVDVSDLAIVGYTQVDDGSNMSKYQFFGNNVRYETRDEQSHATAPIIMQGSNTDIWYLFWTDTFSSEAQDNFSTEIIKEPYGDGLYGAIDKKARFTQEDLPAGPRGLPPVYGTERFTFTDAPDTDARGECHWVNDSSEANVNFFATAAMAPYWAQVSDGDLLVARINDDNYVYCRVEDVATADLSTGEFNFDLEVIQIRGYVNGRAGQNIHIDSAKPEQGIQGIDGFPGSYDTLSLDIYDESGAEGGRGRIYYTDNWDPDTQQGTGSIVARVFGNDYDHWSALPVGATTGTKFAAYINSNNYAIGILTRVYDRSSSIGRIKYDFTLLGVKGLVRGYETNTPRVSLALSSNYVPEGPQGRQGPDGRTASNVSLNRAQHNTEQVSPSQVHLLGTTLTLNYLAEDLPYPTYLQEVPNGTGITIERRGTSNVWIGHTFNKRVIQDGDNSRVEYSVATDASIGNTSFANTNPLRVSIAYAPTGEVGYSAMIFASDNRTYHSASSSVSAGQIHVSETNPLDPANLTGTIYIYNDGFTTQEAHALSNLANNTPINVYTTDHQKRIQVESTSIRLNGSTFEIGYRVLPRGQKGNFADGDTVRLSVGGSGLTQVTITYGDSATGPWHTDRGTRDWARLSVNGVPTLVFLPEASNKFLSGPIVEAPILPRFTIDRTGLSSPWRNFAEWDFQRNTHFRGDLNQFEFDGSQSQFTTSGYFNNRNLVILRNTSDADVVVDRVDMVLGKYPPGSRIPSNLELLVGTHTADVTVPANGTASVRLTPGQAGTYPFADGERGFMNIRWTTQNAVDQNHIYVQTADIEYGFTAHYHADAPWITLDDHYLVFDDPNLPAGEQSVNVIDFFGRRILFDSTGLVGEIRSIPERNNTLTMNMLGEWHSILRWGDVPDTLTVDENIIVSDTGETTILFGEIDPTMSSLRGHNQGSATYTLTELLIEVQVFSAGADPDTDTADRVVEIAHLRANQEEFTAGEAADMSVETTDGDRRVVLEEGEIGRLMITPTPANTEFWIGGHNLEIPYSIEVNELPAARIDLKGDLILATDEIFPENEEEYELVNLHTKRFRGYSKEPGVYFWMPGQTHRTNINHISRSFSTYRISAAETKAFPFMGTPSEIYFEPHEDGVVMVNEDDLLENIDNINDFSGRGSDTGVIQFPQGGIWDAKLHADIRIENSGQYDVTLRESTLNDLSVYRDPAASWRDIAHGPDGLWYLLEYTSATTHVRVYAETRQAGRTQAPFNYVRSFTVTGSSNHVAYALAVTHDRVWVIYQVLAGGGTEVRSYTLTGTHEDTHSITSHVGNPRGLAYYNNTMIALHADGEETGALAFFNSDFTSFIHRISLPNTVHSTSQWRGVTGFGGNIVAMDNGGGHPYIRTFRWPSHSDSSLHELTDFPHRFQTRPILYLGLAERQEDDSLLFIAHQAQTAACYRHGIRHQHDSILARATNYGWYTSGGQHAYRTYVVDHEDWKVDPGKQYYFNMQGIVDDPDVSDDSDDIMLQAYLRLRKTGD